MVIGEKVIALRTALDELEILLNRAEIIAEMQIAGRLYAGKYDVHRGRFYTESEH